MQEGDKDMMPTEKEYAMPEQPKSETFKLGTVTALFANGTAKIRFDGEEEASEKQYSYLASYKPGVNDRVVLSVVAGTYIILGKILFNASPESGTTNLSVPGILTVNGNTTLEGATSMSNTLSVSGKATLSGEVQIGGSLNHDGSYIGFFGKTPTSKRTAYYAIDTNVKNRLNELIQRLGDYGLINPSN